MALSKQKRQVIIDSLISDIGKDTFSNGFSVDDFSVSHGLTKQSIYRYLSSLEAETIISKQKEGRKNKYRLIDTSFHFNYPLPNLSEESVWKKEVRPILQGIADITMSICDYVFNEMLNNAIDHSEGSEVDISVFINAYSVTFMIKDDGVGIFSKIAAAMQFDEKRYAVLELAKGKFTTDPKKHSGEGIFFSAKAADSFAIFSDEILFSSWNLKEIEQPDDLPVSLPSALHCGTVVCFVVFRDNATPISEVFDRYTQAPDDYGFTKTLVPVRLLEHGDQKPTFVSRSQAKRLLARFERFECIELDFTNIEDIGQGFADEVFRVFRNEHPNSKIVAINCNQRVEQMINHVTRR